MSLRGAARKTWPRWNASRVWTNCEVVTHSLTTHQHSRFHVGVSEPPHQWCSQALKSGWAQKVWRMEVHRGVQRWSPGGGLKAKPSEDRYIQTVCSCQMLFYEGLLPSPSLPTPQKTSDQRESHNPTRLGQDVHATALTADNVSNRTAIFGHIHEQDEFSNRPTSILRQPIPFHVL